MGYAGPIALGNEAKKLTDYGNRVEQIRAANAAATVQCADCRQWIDAGKDHTCRQQVRRNQRKAK